MRARRTVSSLVTRSRLMTCRKSSTAVLPAYFPPVLLLAVLPGGGRAGGGHQGPVVDRALFLAVVLLADQGDVVHAGGAGGVVAAAGVFRAGLGGGVPGEVVRGRGPGVLPAGRPRH